jgi:light-harvesting complex I chlorophyll a/b binding protein 1
MIATLGWIVPEYFRFPGYLAPSQNLKFADVPSGIQALNKVPAEGWAQIGMFVAFLELFAMRQEKGRLPGDFNNFGKFGVPNFFGSKADAVKSERSLNAELNNGRLAMIAISGMVAQNGFFGTTGHEMWLPAGAFESELGVQAPVGFWDPLGLAKDGDVDNFKRRRAVELKHGRICMLACVGYIVQEYFRWPGYLSPEKGIKFADIPSGIGAITKVPLEGWLQIGLFIGHYEGYFFRQDPARAPGDFENYGFLGVGKNFIFNFDPPTIKDPEARKKKLSAEIANGRLAMVALMAMLFQNGTVGTAGPAMWLPASAFESELGVQAPVGFWDPLGLAKEGNADDFRRRRGVELKHGRICMLACIGYIVPEYFRWPGYLSPEKAIKFSEVPNGIGAISKVPLEGWLQIGLFIGHYEGYFFRQDPTRAPGDFENYGFLGVGKNFIFNFDAPKINDPEARKRKLNAEIANGRLAMVALMAMLFQNGTVGNTGAAMWLPGSAAFESELGVQAPVGFWDPLGLAKDGDADNFRRRRAVELKHGRICMLACVGYIVPEYFRWPGYLSPEKGIKFADVPHGIGAITKVPLEGWLQIGLFIGHYEGYFFRQDPTRAPGDFENYGFLGVGKNFIFNFDPPTIKDPEARKKKLSAEIANGRLAMVALMAMIFQNGTVGSAGPAMWLPGA